MTEDSLVPIYTANDATRADLIRDALENEGIACAVEGEHQAALTGVVAVRLFVKAEDEARARAFIEEHERVGTDEEE